MDYYVKRGRWCVRTNTGVVKFGSEQDAKDFVEYNKDDPFAKSAEELDFWKEAEIDDLEED